MNALTWTLVLLVGLLVGSYGNSVVFRLPRRLIEEFEDDARDTLGMELKAKDPHLTAARSHCPSCKAQIAWYDNVPVISWLLLRGQCRNCGSSISARYLLLELVGVAVTGGCYAVWGMSYQAIAATAVGFILLWLSAIDIEHLLLPDKLVYPLLWLGLTTSVWSLFISSNEAIVGAGLGYGMLATPALLYKLLRGREGLGGGDAKLTAAIGAFVGPIGVVASIFLGSVLAVLCHVLLRLRGRTSSGTPLPFGPTLSLGGAITLALQHWHILDRLFPALPSF